VGINANGGAELGYLFVAVVCLAAMAARVPRRVKDEDDLALEHEHRLFSLPPAADITADLPTGARAGA
jgi:AGZA family xanthine/uracil permease-like MFS transporter